MNFLRLSIIVLLVIAATAFGQQTAPERWSYVAMCEATGTSLKCSVSLPSNSTRRIRLISAVVVCATATCSYTITRDGTTPTATAGTIAKNRSVSPAPDGKWWTASNSTGGTSLPGAVVIPSATALPLDVSDIDILAGQNASIAIASTGSQQLQIFCKWEEVG